MDRQEAIEILRKYQKECVNKGGNLDKAINTLIAPIAVTDEMVERVSNKYNHAYKISGYQRLAIEAAIYETLGGNAKAALTAALGGDDAAN